MSARIPCASALLASTLVLSSVPSLLAQASGPAPSLHATTVVDYQQGPGGGLFDPDAILDGPLGAGLMSGSLDVLTLGEGGQVTLGFDVVLRDGPGADLTVFENGFIASLDGGVFAELAYVEVSTHGDDWARFPSRYGPPLGGGAPAGTFAGLCGGTPVLANVDDDPSSPFDPVRSGGEALDLAELSRDPLVQAGLVDLSDIRFVRLIDVAPGGTDSEGTVLPLTGSADIDAVTVLNHAGEGEGDPICDLRLDSQGFIRWRLGDPDGFADLDLDTLTSSVALQPFDLGFLFTLFEITGFDGDVVSLRSVAPTAAVGVTTVMAISVADDGDRLSGDQVVFQAQ